MIIDPGIQNVRPETQRDHAIRAQEAESREVAPVGSTPPARPLALDEASMYEAGKARSEETRADASDKDAQALDAERIAQIKDRIAAGAFNTEAVLRAVVDGVMADYPDLAE